jgi:hypothetical protein
MKQGERSMKNRQVPGNRTPLRIVPIACATALAVTFAVSRLEQAYAHGGHVTPPPVPANIEVPEGNRAYLEGHAVGTQNYICLASGSAFAWTLFTDPPVATMGGRAAEC